MPKEATSDDVRRLSESGAQLLEVLPREEYESAHLPGAINIPLKTFSAATLQTLDRNRPVVVYCYDYQ